MLGLLVWNCAAGDASHGDGDPVTHDAASGEVARAQLLMMGLGADAAAFWYAGWDVGACCAGLAAE